MGVELVIEVSRAQDDRLSGNVRLAHGADGRDFSGTLELMRVFEELVPADRRPDEPVRTDRRPDEPAVPGRDRP